jgi:hypothetical protein
MASNYPPQPAQYPQQPQKKKTSPIVWILLGVGAFFLLIIIAFAGLIGFGLYKAKQAGIDPDLIKRNPAVAIVKMAVAANPDAELISLDESRGIVTVRDKKTGKIVTMNFQDVKKGRFSFESASDKMTIEGEGQRGQMKVESAEGTATIGAGGSVQLPAWFPAYPGVKAEGTYSMTGTKEDAGSVSFTSKDSVEQVIRFYEDGLKKAGLKVSTLKQEKGGMVTGSEDGDARSAMVMLSAESEGTKVTATFKTKK